METEINLRLELETYNLSRDSFKKIIEILNGKNPVNVSITLNDFKFDVRPIKPVSIEESIERPHRFTEDGFFMSDSLRRVTINFIR